MKKMLLFWALVLSVFGAAIAQKPQLQFNVEGGSSSIKLIYRLNQGNATAKVDMGNGESALLEQGAAGELRTLDYTFTKTSAEDRTIKIDADNIVVLRISSSKSVNGIVSLESPTLQTLNMDYTKLPESPVVDFSKCPNIAEITLNDCDVEEVDLPKEPKLHTFQSSPALFSQKGIKRLDLSKCSNLQTLGLNGVALDTIDLRACPKLQQLVVKGVSTKLYPKAILGAKELKGLTLVNIQMCGLGYDMLPDLNETSVDNFVIKNLYSFNVDPSRVNGLTVDLSHLHLQNGISPTLVPTVYTWKRIDGTTLVDIPATQIKEKDGVFTFDASLLGADGTVGVRCLLNNPGYNSLEKFAYYKTGYATTRITLSTPKPTAQFKVTSVSPGVDEDGEEIDEISFTMHLGAEVLTPIIIDWGNGTPVEYTIKAGEPQSITQTVDLGAVVKIYGLFSHLDATRCSIEEASFNKANYIKVLRIGQNKIATLDLSSLTELKELMVTDNKLTELSLNALTKLEELYCGYNQLTSLELANNTLLSLLNCNNNKLTALDVAMLQNLNVFVPSDNALGGALDLTANSKLSVLDISNCGVTELKLSTPQLVRLVAYNNSLSALNMEVGKEQPKLYFLDLRKNNFDACTLNDILLVLPITPETLLTDVPQLFVGENPGAATYDVTLIPTKEGSKTWTVDVEGDATGCTTAKIYDGEKGKELNGTVTLLNANAPVAFETPINKNTALVLKVVPAAGYQLAYYRFNETSYTATSANPKANFDLTLDKNGILYYGFQKDTSLESPFAQPFIIRTIGDTFIIEELQAVGAPYALFNAEGQLVASGKVSAEGSLELTISTQGLYLLKVGDATLKLVR